MRLERNGLSCSQGGLQSWVSGGQKLKTETFELIELIELIEPIELMSVLLNFARHRGNDPVKSNL